MSDDPAAVMAAFKKVMAGEKRARKSDEIIDFITDNWQLFTATKKQMREAKSQLGTSTDYSVDALCDLLGIPNNVFFKRSPVVDVSGALLDFANSKLMKLFIDCCAKSRGVACLVLVAGTKSVCITNMQTAYPAGSMVMYYKPLDQDAPDIQIFGMNDAPNRLPRIFGKKMY